MISFEMVPTGHLVAVAMAVLALFVVSIILWRVHCVEVAIEDAANQSVHYADVVDKVLTRVKDGTEDQIVDLRTELAECHRVYEVYGICKDCGRASEGPLLKLTPVQMRCVCGKPSDSM